MFQTTPQRNGNTASYKYKEAMCQTRQAVGVRVEKSVRNNDAKTGQPEKDRFGAICKETRGEEGESASTKQEKGGDVVFSPLRCCERIHFGLAGAGMRGSSGVCKFWAVEQERQIRVQDLSINERDLCFDDFLYNPLPDPSCGCKSLAETVSHKHNKNQA